MANLPERQITCLNGQFMLAQRAAVPVSDRGFRFGDGVFETIRLVEGVPYQWDLHMARLAQGLAALRITAPVEDWRVYAQRMIRRNHVTGGFLRIAVSRGSGSKGYLPYPPGMPATWVIEYAPPAEARAAPCQLWLSSMQKIAPQALPMQKLAQGVNATLALLEAQDHHCDEALQLNAAGFVSEAAAANIFWLKENILYTPALDVGCLNGTTRDAVLRLAPIATRSVQAGLGALEQADAVFLTNSRAGMWPVESLRPMGWKYNPHHALITNMAKLLQADRLRAAADQRAVWAA